MRRLVLFALLVFQSGIVSSQTETTKPAPQEELRLLKLQLDSLRAVIAALQDEQELSSEGFEERLDKRLEQLESKIDAISRATTPTILNPRTTAFLNLAARIDNGTVIDYSGQHQIDNRPFLRSAELDLRNAVDPYAEAVAILSVENEAGDDFAIDVEEGYGLIKRLPLLEEAPLGLKMKLGKFRPALGMNNRIHMHDLPWTTRPLVVGALLGTEHGEFFEGGFAGTGVDFDFFLPNPIPQSTLEMNVSVVRAGGLGMSVGGAGAQPAYIGHLNLSADWTNEHLLILGASAYKENGSVSTQLVGCDLTYRWAPAENRESHSFVAGGEAFAGKHVWADTAAMEQTMNPYGWFAYLQWQTSYWLYLGARYDWLREPADDRILTQAISGYLSYYTTEFLRFRLGFERLLSGTPGVESRTTGIFEVNFVFGSHPTEPYWVNR